MQLTNQNQIAATKAGKLQIKRHDVNGILSLSFSSHFKGGGLAVVVCVSASVCVCVCMRGEAAGCDESYPERLFILVLLLELKQECWSQLKPNT